MITLLYALLALAYFILLHHVHYSPTASTVS